MRGREAVPHKVDDDCLRELRWLYDRRDLAEARRDLAAAWLAKWQATYPKLRGWVEADRGGTDLLPAAAPSVSFRQCYEFRCTGRRRGEERGGGCEHKKEALRMAA